MGSRRCGPPRHLDGSAPLLTSPSPSTSIRPRTELRRLGRTLNQRARDILAYFGRPGTSNGPTEALNGRLEHLRGSALGFRNLTNYIARSLLETGGFRPRLHARLRREPHLPAPRRRSKHNGVQCWTQAPSLTWNVDTSLLTEKDLTQHDSGEAVFTRMRLSIGELPAAATDRSSAVFRHGRHPIAAWLSW
jgi:hypothetical protein